jgi:hypothetical protein
VAHREVGLVLERAIDGRERVQEVRDRQVERFLESARGGP